MWFKWFGMLMELLFGPPLEDGERDFTDDETERMIEEADDYGIHSEYYESKQREAVAGSFGKAKSRHDD